MRDAPVVATTAVAGSSRALSTLAVGSLAAVVVALPVLQPSGPANTAPVDIPIALALVGVAGSLALRGRAPSLPYLISAGLFMSGGLIGAAAGPVPWNGLVAVTGDAGLLLLCWAVASAIDSTTAGQRLIDVWSLAAVAWAAVLVVAFATGNASIAGTTPEQGTRASSTFGNPNLAANYFVTSLFVLWSSRRPTRPLWRTLASAVVVVAIVVTGSNGALVALAAGAVAAGAAASWHRGRAPALLLYASVVLAIALTTGLVARRLEWNLSSVQQWAGNSQYELVKNSIGRGGRSATAREELLREATMLMDEGWLWGHGPTSTKHRLAQAQATAPKEAHNDYVAAMTERGLLGVVGLLLLLVAAAARLAGIAPPLDAARGDAVPPADLTRLSAGLIGCGVAFATAGLFYEVMHFRHFWFYLGVVAAVSNRGER